MDDAEPQHWWWPEYLVQIGALPAAKQTARE